MTLNIEQLGHRGDGIARFEGRTIFVADTLPGESVRALVTGERGIPIKILSAAPDRITPFCPNFCVCGGCTAQHMSGTAYTRWKRGIVETALKNRALITTVAPLIDAHGRGRRRATLHAAKVGKDWIVGFSGARGHRVFDLDQCPILVPDLNGVPDIVREIARGSINTGRFDAHATFTDSGVDLQLVGVEAPTLDMRTAIAAAAERYDLARIALDDEIVAVRREPRIQMGSVSVPIPPGAFLQATDAAEQILSEFVRAHLAGRRHVADLFAGLGPFALRLAANASVEAFDSDPGLIGGLLRAARQASILRPVKAETRDLFIRPLAGPELDRFDGIVLDPPRAGAEAQSRLLASSQVPVIAYVSCDAASFARDAALLVGGGYRLDQVHPVDQFKWSNHVELVGLFQR
jgi:23S rRNA (uracil1939-C5)-methyltransferase